MTEQLRQLINRLSRGEQKLLENYISKEFTVETGDGMLRDDITAKIFYILQSLHPWLKENLREDETFIELYLGNVEIAELVKVLLVEFELEDIAFSKVMEWQKLSDVIDYIENMIEEKQEPYISGFEVEA